MRYSDYLKAAFNAKPHGMFVAPNWIGVGVFGLLGLLNPGFWLVGAGLEAAYLFSLANSSRFRRAVDAAEGPAKASPLAYHQRIANLLGALPSDEAGRYRDFAAKCRRTVQTVPDNTSLHETLAHVTWLFLQLLTSRAAVLRLLAAARREDQEEGTLADRIAALEARLAQSGHAEDLRRTLESTRDILKERRAAQLEMESKLGYLDAELSRLEEQVSLLHDRAQLDRDTPALTSSIDHVTSGISGATAWMSREKELLGDLGGSLDEPPPAAILESEA